MSSGRLNPFPAAPALHLQLFAFMPMTIDLQGMRMGREMTRFFSDARGMGWRLARQPGPAAGARLPCKAIILRALRDKREQRAEERERGREGGVEGGREGGRERVVGEGGRERVFIHEHGDGPHRAPL